MYIYDARRNQQHRLIDDRYRCCFVCGTTHMARLPCPRCHPKSEDEVVKEMKPTNKLDFQWSDKHKGYILRGGPGYYEGKNAFREQFGQECDVCFYKMESGEPLWVFVPKLVNGTSTLSADGRRHRAQDDLSSNGPDALLLPRPEIVRADDPDFIEQFRSKINRP